MEARELNEWMAYWSLEPWGEVRADHRAGLIASMVLNSQGAKNKGKPYESSDFFELYEAGKAKQKQTGYQMMSLMKGLANNGER